MSCLLWLSFLVISGFPVFHQGMEGAGGSNPLMILVGLARRGGSLGSAVSLVLVTEAVELYSLKFVFPRHFGRHSTSSPDSPL